MDLSEYDIEAAAEATCCVAIPQLVRKPLVSGTLEFKDVDPEVMDLLIWGQSPGPHIILGEN